MKAQTNNIETLDKSDSEDKELSYTCGDCQDFGSVCTRKMGVERSDKVGKCGTFKINKSGVDKTKKEKAKAKQTAPNKIRISQLCSKYVGKVVEVDVQIVGQKDQKALPCKALFHCAYCDTAFDVDIQRDKLSIQNKYVEKMIFGNPDIVLKEFASWRISQKTCVRGNKNTTHAPLVEITKHMDYAILHVRDILDNTGKFGDSIYKDRLIYLINQKIPKGKLIKIKGYVVIDPHSQDITIIADSIESLESEVSKFSIGEDDKQNFPKYFNDLEIVAKQISPDTVGEKRDIAKKSIALLLHSPHTIPDINGNQIRGGLRIVFIGDTKCDKSRMGGDISGANSTAYRFGEFFIGETGGRTGLTYTIDNENKLLIWGMIPLNDKALVVIDGMASISGNEFKQFREALEIQKVIVRRSQSGEAWARTRLIGCMNPNKPMNQYLFPCMAIPDNFIFKEPPDISRWELFIPFAIEDVSQSEIMKRKPTDRPIPDDIFKRHIQFAWSREPEHIVYTDVAKKQIVAYSIEIVKDYSISSLPIVHNGFRNILTSLSVAYACAEHSTNDTHENIIVKASHVKKASEFYIEVLEALGLKDYKLHEEGELNITDTEITRIHKELGEIEYGILEAISFNAMSSTDLADKFAVDPKTIKRHYEPLKKHNLIKTKQGKGIELTARGIKFLKGDTQKDRDIGTKSVPKSIENYEIGTENAPISNNTFDVKSKNDTNLENSEKLYVPISPKNVPNGGHEQSKVTEDIGTENAPMSLMKNIPLCKKDSKDTVKSTVIKDSEMSQKEQIKYICDFIEMHDKGEGVSKDTIIDIAKERIPNIENIIEHLLKDGVIYQARNNLKLSGGSG